MKSTPNQLEIETESSLFRPVVLALTKSPIVDKYDLSSLECIVSAAAPLGNEIEMAVGKRFGEKLIVKQAGACNHTLSAV
jgi:acyl-coenzyme A synthetase/AMP-(fatty) acid ligase